MAQWSVIFLSASVEDIFIKLRNLLEQIFSSAYLQMCGRFDLLVSGGSQSQNYGVSNLQHGLQDGSNDDEEDDGKEEGSVDDLQLDQTRLHSKDEQSDAFCHPSVEM